LLSIQDTKLKDQPPIIVSEIHENNKGFLFSPFPEPFPVLENANTLQEALIMHSNHPLPLSHPIARVSTSEQTIPHKGKGKDKEEEGEEDNEQSPASRLHAFNTKTDLVMQTSAIEEYSNLFTTPAPLPTQLPHFPAIKILNPTPLLPIYSGLEHSDPNLAPKLCGMSEFRTVRCWRGSLQVVLDDTAEELTITSSTPNKKDVYPHLISLLYAKLAAIGEEWEREREREAWAHADDQDQEAGRFGRKLEPEGKIEEASEHESATARRPSWGDRVDGDEDVNLEVNWGPLTETPKQAQKVEKPTGSLYDEQECELDYDMQSEVTESGIESDFDSYNTEGGASISPLDPYTGQELASDPSTSYCISTDQAPSPFPISLLDLGMNPMPGLSQKHVEEDLISFYDSETSYELGLLPGSFERDYNVLCSRDLSWEHILSRGEGIIIDEKKRDEVEENLIDF